MCCPDCEGVYWRDQGECWICEAKGVPGDPIKDRVAMSKLVSEAVTWEVTTPPSRKKTGGRAKRQAS